MCLYGVYKKVMVINPEQNRTDVSVDACIADEIRELNNLGVMTLGCCCNHGEAGQEIQIENAYGLWKTARNPPNALIHENSVNLIKKLGYKPYPYYYTDGKMGVAWQVPLKTGCVTKEECKSWHEKHGISFEKNLGIIE